MMEIPPGCLKFRDLIASQCDSKVRQAVEDIVNRTNYSLVISDLRYNI